MRFSRHRLLVLLFILLLSLTYCYASADGIIIPYEMKTIEKEAFSGIKAVSVTIPDSVATIASKAFASCSSLKDVYLPFHRVDIADDAFDSTEITFHVYLGSANANWAANHGNVEYINGSITTGSWRQVNNLISGEAVSLTADNPYYTHRLIVKTKSNNNLPALDQYNPKAIVSINSNLFVVQFENDTDASTCANALKAWGGCQYVEVDYFLSSADSARGSSTGKARGLTSKGINASDPMGFGAYVDYLGDNVGNVTIAVIDTGVNAGDVSCNVSSKSYDFINNRSNAVSGFTSHGTLVAQTLCDSFGSLSNHLTIISYRVENPANSNISYIQMGEAILKAKEDGADFINISIAGESTYATFQDNEFLRECINSFGREKVIAAGGNSATSVDNFIPAKYCTSVTGVKLENGELYRASGTALHANFGGFASTTSVAAPKVAAAMALVKLDPESSHTFANALVNDNASKNGMPNLEKLTVKVVERITFADYSANDTIILEVGDPLSIQYGVYPANVTVSTVTPVSSDNNIIKYKSHSTTHARFTANAPGTAEIIFTSDDGGAEARLTVQVIQLPLSVKINGGVDELLYKGESVALSADILPTTATNQDIIWTSSNNSVARVSNVSEDTKSCVITQVGDGDVVITATAQANSEATDSVILHFTSVSAPSSIVITPVGGMNTIYKGKTTGSVQMIAQVIPYDADQTVEWSSSNTSVAIIDINSGVVTAVGAGETIISARAVTGNATGIYDHISVIQLPTSITVSGTTSIVAGNTTTLNALVEPGNANNKTVTWGSSNTEVATVSNNGIVTAISEGNALISATSVADGTVAGSCYITVLPAKFTVTFDANGGSCNQSSMIATKGVKLGTLPTAIRDYYNFDGWYTEPVSGSRVTGDTTYNTTNAVTVYAHWSLKPEKGWVIAGSQPSGAQITQTSWSYRASTESTSSSLSGWTANGNYWNQVGSGSKQYASFPSTYDTSHSTYTQLNGSAYTSYENETSKRTVSNTHAGYVYWHWAYNSEYANRQDRWISDRKQWAGSSRNLENFYYQYFFAFKSTTNAPAFSGFSWTWGASAKYDSSKQTYNCANCLPSGANTGKTSGLNNPRFLRLDYYNSTYTDYQKVFKYYKDYSYSSSDPGNGADITNKVQYVKYREK